MVTQRHEIAVFCGGPGLRMSKLTLKKQKCMLKVKGKPILEHLLEQISGAFDSAKVILLTGYHSNSIHKYFGEKYKRLKLEYAPESKEGTRLSLLSAEGLVKNDNFLLTSGDIIVRGSEFLNLINAKNYKSLGVMLLSKDREIAPTHSQVTMKNCVVLKIKYPPGKLIFRDTYSSIGAGFYSRRLFNKLKKHDVFDTAEMLAQLVKEGEFLEGRICATPWFHFVSLEDLKVKIEF